MGSYGGQLASISATDLGAIAINDAVLKAQIPAEDTESIAMGNVLSANLGQAPARQASMAAGLPESVCATTINKVCASGMKAISVVYNDIMVDNIEVGIAGGMESMSLVPHYLPNGRFGMGYGNGVLIDGLAKDGLTDVYNKTSMGVSGDKTAEKYQITREEQDDLRSNPLKKQQQRGQMAHFQMKWSPSAFHKKRVAYLKLTKTKPIKRPTLIRCGP